jgi:hypothetical protein
VFKGGLELKFFEQHEFESQDKAAPELKSLIIARNALRLLMMGWPASWQEFISWPVFKAIFIRRYPALLSAMRLAFQQGFNHLFEQLRPLSLNEEQEEQVQLYLSNCLSILPYSDLTPYESIKIPQLINKQWELVDYSVKPIELTPRVTFDMDRVFAYGLKPIHHAQAQSHLIFMGTTYPEGQGLGPQLDTDFKAFDTVGNTLYQCGRKAILSWLSHQPGKIHVCGASLGGALSLLFALDQGEHISRVDALNPPGLASTWYENEYDCWDKLSTKPKVVVQQQANDPVSFFGLWRTEWEIIQVTPPKEKQGPNLLFDHFLNYAGFAETQFSYLSPDEENQKRTYRNFFIFSLARSLVYYALVLPYIWFIRPSGQFLYEQSQQKAQEFSIVISSFFNILVDSFWRHSTFIYNKVFGLKQDNLAPLKSDNPNLAHAKLHDPKLPRNADMDIYNSANALDLELSLGELNTYYKMMRCLVKQKELMPKEDKPFKHGKHLSKKELLLASQNPQHAHVPIRLHMSKAKIMHIKDTLSLVNKIGMHHQKQLKEALEQRYEHYCTGKMPRARSSKSWLTP